MLERLTQRRAVGMFLWVLVWLAWWDCWEGVTGTKWGGEVARFGWMAAVLALFLASGRLGRWLPPARTLGAIPIVLAVCLLAWPWLTTAAHRLSLPERAGAGQDVALNTLAAENWVLAGQNPYQHRAQVQHELKAGPHVTVEGGETKLFGVRYAYGFPYYPGMFLSYLPFRLLAKDVHSIALANLLLMVVNAALIFLLARSVVPAGLAVAAILAVLTLPDELFQLAITDWVIAPYALAAALMLSRGSWAGAGVFLGLALSCKLMPGALLVAAALWWLWGKEGFRPALLGVLITLALVVGPFVLWSPAEFFSSTVLFYRAFHWQGDNSALWFVLPEAARPIFSAVGLIGTVGFLFLARRGDWLHAMRMAFASYWVFIAFARMIHLNYFWSLLPLGAAVFFIHLAREPEPS